ncbi:MAG TPA: cytochrome c biogenesis protein CcdA [Firmicutes bacterium]|nr:cytochrome c biogenesis protein CcdA [Candidatus Fermentithermobacillaceae bacterium]
MEYMVRGLGNPVLAPVYALLAGILTSGSPCALAALPLVVGHLAGTQGRGRGRALVLFITGMVVSLTVAGIIAGVVGRTLSLTVPAIRWVAGIAFIVGGLAYLGIFGRSETCKVSLPFQAVAPQNGETPENQGEGRPATKRLVGRSLAGLAMGALYGLSASPCATPALLAILTLVATTGSLVRGAMLLLAYSIGQSLLVILAGLATSGFRAFFEKERNVAALELLRKVGGALILGVGLYLLIRPYLNLP